MSQGVASSDETMLVKEAQSQTFCRRSAAQFARDEWSPVWLLNHVMRAFWASETFVSMRS